MDARNRAAPSLAALATLSLWLRKAGLDVILSRSLRASSSAVNKQNPSTSQSASITLALAMMDPSSWISAYSTPNCGLKEMSVIFSNLPT